jgi:hypothetical protein
MSTAPIRTRSVCPKCGKDLCLRSACESVCVSCNQPVRISWSYRRQVSLIALAIVVLIAFATYHQTSAGPWIIGLVLLWLLITFVLSIVVPPTYEPGYLQPQLTFVAAFIGMFLTVFLVEFVGFLTLYIVLGAKPADIQEELEMLSEPLRWFGPQFLITPHKGFLDVCGIILGNSFFIGIPVFLCTRLVQLRLRRGRVLQMGIASPLDETDD